MKSQLNRFLSLLCALPLAAAAAPALVDVQVFPPDVNLTSRQDKQSIVVQATYADGVTRDVTGEAKLTLGNAKLAKLDKAIVRPLADGATELKVSFGGKTITLPVKVEKSAVEEPVSFAKDVIPAITKSGCNTGSCHGTARGKDGFRISLFGYDPDGDYQRFTREQLTRRINLAVPEESLMIEKGAGLVQHSGGKTFGAGDELYEAVLRWIKEGAPADVPNRAKVVDVQIYPRQSVLEGKDAKQQFTVRASYSDGTDRDVTTLAVFMSNNDGSAKPDKAGLVTAGVRGEAFVMARFDAFTVGSQVLVVPKGQQFVWPTVKENNYVDTLVHAKLKKIRITPSEVCDDATFLRRVYLDIIGRMPTTDEVKRFVSDAGTGKREAVVDELLKRPEFTEMWVMKWAELLQIRSSDQALTFGYKSALQYYDWLEKQISQNVPVDQMVRSLLTASGGSFENPAANFYKVERDTLKTSENVAQVFMGMRIQCAQCHNHPFDRWTMNDYYSFAAFFAQVGRKSGEDPRETVVFNSKSGGVSHPVAKKDMPPKFLGAEQPDLKDRDRREVLAEWFASPRNPWFAKNLANIVWAHFFGKGIIDPVDDVRVSNPASNPELLDKLAAQFTDYKYDFRKLVRDICTSRTYQLSVVANPSNQDDTANFAKAYVRRIRAEVLLDAINQVTETDEKFRGLPRGSRAVEIADGRTTTFFLTTFGRATRETPCSCEVKMEPNLSQALHLLNGDTVNQKIQAGGVVRKLLKEGKTNDQVMEEIYLRALGRPPTKDEAAKLTAFFTEGKSADQVLNDIFWSLLNAKEFVFNH
ncbi:MAG: DUF1549 domain-containing protein [Verrucomicrobia bacterium]|nr:DUF1549 domain-containing protein [Verrucomicrobiota bacterium]